MASLRRAIKAFRGVTAWLSRLFVSSHITWRSDEDCRNASSLFNITSKCLRLYIRGIFMAFDDGLAGETSLLTPCIYIVFLEAA